MCAFQNQNSHKILLVTFCSISTASSVGQNKETVKKRFLKPSGVVGDALLAALGPEILMSNPLSIKLVINGSLPHENIVSLLILEFFSRVCCSFNSKQVYVTVCDKTEKVLRHITDAFISSSFAPY